MKVLVRLLRLDFDGGKMSFKGIYDGIIIRK